MVQRRKYPDIWLRDCCKPWKPQISRWPVPDSNGGPPEYEYRALPLCPPGKYIPFLFLSAASCVNRPDFRTFWSRWEDQTVRMKFCHDQFYINVCLSVCLSVGLVCTSYDVHSSCLWCNLLSLKNNLMYLVVMTKHLLCDNNGQSRMISSLSHRSWTIHHKTKTNPFAFFKLLPKYCLM